MYEPLGKDSGCTVGWAKVQPGILHLFKWFAVAFLLFARHCLTSLFFRNRRLSTSADRRLQAEHR